MEIDRRTKMKKGRKEREYARYDCCSAFSFLLSEMSIRSDLRRSAEEDRLLLYDVVARIYCNG